MQRFAPGRADIGPDTTIEALGLSSLERVELLMAIEEHSQTTIDEVGVRRRRAPSPTWRSWRAKARRGWEHRSRAEAGGSRQPRPPAKAGATAEDGPVTFPTWNRRWPFTWLRNVSLPTWILPIGRVFAWVTVEGLEHLEGLDGPVVFAANHQSHLDGP